jgi:serine/threonine protein kinase
MSQHSNRYLILLIVSLAMVISANAQRRTGPYRPGVIGEFQIPVVDPATMPSFCSDFTSACQAEANDDYEEAVKLYEDRYPLCGDFGWNVTGSNKGSNDFVVFKTSPCGTPMAIKAAHSAKECKRLKELTTGTAYEECPGCFPRYYALSNVTNCCYSEFILTKKYNVLRKKPELFHRVKALYLQGITAIRTLRSHNVEHRDLSYRNLLFREVVDDHGLRHLRLVLFDFGASLPLDGLEKLDPKPVSAGPRVLSNGRFPDIFALTCTFTRHLYNRFECRDHAMDLPEDRATLLYAFAKIMQDNELHSQSPNYQLIAKLVKQAKDY